MSDKSELRERLERETQLGASIGNGWWPPVEAAATLLDAAYPGWKSGQIKEKFGGLRFYIDPAPYPEDREKEYDERGIDQDTRDRWRNEWYQGQEAIATAAERACADVCENCGKSAETKTENYWVRTECDECAAGREQRRKEMWEKHA